MLRRCNLVASFFATLLCCAACAPSGQQTVPAPGALPQGIRAVGDKQTLLFVGGAQLSEYQLGSAKPLRTVKLHYLASAIAADRSGNVSVLESYGSGSTLIQVYRISDLTLLREITYGVPGSDLKTDQQGYLFVSAYGTLYVYTPGGARLIYRLRRFPAGPLAFDSSGNLYTGNAQVGRIVAIYAPTDMPGHLKFLRDIHHGVYAPVAFAFGPSDELFVANWPGGNPPLGKPRISVFAAGGSKPTRKIFDGLALPDSVAVDSTGRLYAANSNIYAAPPWRSWVSVYAPGGAQPIGTIAKGHGCFPRLAIDGSENLYVANCGEVDVYSPGGAKLLYKIPKPRDGARALAIGSL
jgi:hypothetical protein